MILNAWFAVGTFAALAVLRSIAAKLRPWNAVLGTTFDDAEIADGSKNVNGIVEAFVALPFTGALSRMVEVFYPPTGVSATFQVRDLGPWFVDDAYWQSQDGRPLAQCLFERDVTDEVEARLDAQREKFRSRAPTNPAGIDLTPAAWERLGLAGVELDRARRGLFSAPVLWRFV